MLNHPSAVADAASLVQEVETSLAEILDLLHSEAEPPGSVVEAMEATQALTAELSRLLGTHSR